MPKKDETKADEPRTKFVQIIGDGEVLYALGVAGHVFVYVDDKKTGEHGWYQLDHDETRGANRVDSGKIKFVQIAGDSDALYAFDDSGLTYEYDDDEEGWVALQYDAERFFADDTNETDDE